VRWRKELEEPPFVKRYFVSVEKVGREEDTVEKRKERRRAMTLLQFEIEHIVIRHSLLIQTRAVFLACCCSCVCEFMNQCLYVLMICCRCVISLNLQVTDRIRCLLGSLIPSLVLCGFMQEVACKNTTGSVSQCIECTSEFCRIWTELC
jgi:hypothetical protein